MKLNFKMSLSIVLIMALPLICGCGVNNEEASDPKSQAGLYSSDWLQQSNPSNDDSLGNLSSVEGYNDYITDVMSQFDDISPSLSSAPSSSNAPSNTITSQSPVTSQDTVTSTPQITPPEKDGFNMVGVWISCFEMPFIGADATTARTAVYEMMKNVKDRGYNTVFCHVRPFGDALYPSDYFPFSKYASGTEGVNPGYDPLKLMITAAKSYGLEFHAWINPYRVSTSTTDPTKLSSDNIAASWLTDGSGRAAVSGKGIYFNPASNDVKRLILNGVKEILARYNVDGIHFDDYFYPTTTDNTFDADAYSEYCLITKTPLALADWRRANVSALVAMVYSLCKQKGATFGISPAGDISTKGIDLNYSKLYADVPRWMSTPGYVDYIIPQIYFGYNHPKENSRYSRLLSIWCSLPRHSELKLYIGLGAYRMDEPCDDSAEWHGDDTLMSRQVEDAYNGGMCGAVVFSYTSSISQKEHNKNQIDNMFMKINYIRSKQA